MSRLDDLISELCPDGVEFKKLNLVCKIYDGTHSTPDYKESGVKFVSVENIGNLYATTKYISEEAFEKYKIKPQIDDVLMTRIGSIGVCTVVDREEPLAYYVSLALLRPDTKIIMSKYLKYIIESKYGRKELRRRTLVNAVPIKINKDDIGKIVIPVPPLEVQREIVQILDKFTLLTAELTAELTARRKQYDYYGNMLFEGIDDKTEIHKVGDVISSLKTGLNPRKNFTLNEPGACYPYITGKDIFDNQINVTEKTDMITPQALELINKRAQLEKGLLLFASTGTGTVGRMAIIDEYKNNWGMSETLYGIKVDESVILPQYLMYFLYSVAARKQFEPKITKGSVPHLKVKDLLNVKIPVPSVEMQKNIVDILSRFDKLCNGMMEGLPAEIDARNKQYEYYRDKLLTFKEAV